MRGADFAMGLATGLLLDVLISLLPQPFRVVASGVVTAALVIYAGIGAWRSHQAAKQGAHFTRTVIAEIERRQRERK